MAVYGSCFGDVHFVVSIARVVSLSARMYTLTLLYSQGYIFTWSGPSSSTYYLWLHRDWYQSSMDVFDDLGCGGLSEYRNMDGH